MYSQLKPFYHLYLSLVEASIYKEVDYMHQIILLNKPYGILTQFSGTSKEHTLAAYINIPNIYPAGRLDKNSEGLLLLTDNGKLQHQLSHPKFNKEKYYWVQVEGAITDEALEPLRRGMIIRNIPYLPAKARLISEPANLWLRDPPIRVRKTIPTSWIELVINEGKNHQVRHMTAAIGYPTLRLIRHRIGQWQIGTLQPGEFCQYTKSSF